MTVARLGQGEGGLDCAEQEDWILCSGVPHLSLPCFLKSTFAMPQAWPGVSDASSPPHAVSLLSPLSHSLAIFEGPSLSPAGFYSHGRKACLSTVEELSPQCANESFGHMLRGDWRLAQVSQDKYCPFVSAECRAQQTDELKIK